VLVAVGDEIPVPGRGDRCYPFRAHSEYLYLADRERPRGVLAYAAADGWVEFVAPVTAEELLWTGHDGEGVGHLVGLGVRDTGPASGEDREPRDGLPRLRVDTTLAPRRAWTVEPGVYVVPALLAGERGRADVDWERVDELRGFGGVRLEQTVLVTDDGCEILTAAVSL